MGWWSATILGGDTPLDILGEFADILGVDNEGGLSELYEYSFTKRNLSKKANLDKLMVAAKEHDETSIAHQVLGVILMSTGSHIPTKLRIEIIQQAKQDEWYLENDDERVYFINDLINKITNYKDKPTFVDTEGLMKKFNDHIKSGKKGLINKNLKSMKKNQNIGKAIKKMQEQYKLEERIETLESILLSPTLNFLIATNKGVKVDCNQFFDKKTIVSNVKKELNKLKKQYKKLK